MGHLIQQLFFALGGFTRWLYCMFMNVVFDKNYIKNIGYYLFEDDNETDNSGMDSNKKNFVIGIFAFIFIITMLQINN
ncbi:hypothetical protein [Flavobacterium sp.]|jgi:hypothetical protein|uniref:hypothetical protein n=1 Tax=Flavobacterium sp. TaxID=239 RepID=UPI0037BFA21E